MLNRHLLSSFSPPIVCAAAVLVAISVGLPSALAASPAHVKANTPNVTPNASNAPTRQSASLPPEVEAALVRAKLPRDAMAAVVIDAQNPRAQPRVMVRGDEPLNPASVMKLVTTYAALDLLGPAYTWSTQVYIDGTVQNGSLRGNVYIKGGGDPQLVMERLWLLVRRLQAQGIKVIVGDIVLDRSSFKVPEHDAASFDGEPLRPYNASPDALLLNYKSVVMTLVPDVAAGAAWVQYDPPLAGMQVQASVPLAPAKADCGDWRGGLRANFSDPNRITFAGTYPATCGEKVWPVAYANPPQFAGRAVEGMWRYLGGSLTGAVRDGVVPSGLQPVFSMPSASLTEVVRDVNKYSNNVMAQHVFLAIDRPTNGAPISFDGARDALRQWWGLRWGADTLPIADNGSGLSRDARIAPMALARMLQTAWASPVMPELLASLPIAGVDGTMRRSNSKAGGAHIKTGSLRDVVARAGFVDGDSGKRYVLVAIINHPNAAAARPAMDALIDWAARDQ